MWDIVYKFGLDEVLGTAQSLPLISVFPASIAVCKQAKKGVVPNYIYIINFCTVYLWYVLPRLILGNLLTVDLYFFVLRYRNILFYSLFYTSSKGRIL